ncbi:hypothetical protein B0H13DRAFT_2360466 [Mycena leptocephala]|nr:hypothetical protein B0H13DRAFT_2360466 [Mycena leptocephala]
MSTPPPTYSARVDNVDMDTGTDTNLARDNPTDASDTETDDSMPDLIPASSVTPDETTATNGAHSATVPTGVTTLIQHIGSLSIGNSVTNGVHPGRRPIISTDPRRETANVPAAATATSDHAHITKLHGETRLANQAIRQAVLASIEETGNHRRFNILVYRAHPTGIKESEYIKHVTFGILVILEPYLKPAIEFIWAVFISSMFSFSSNFAC